MPDAAAPSIAYATRLAELRAATSSLEQRSSRISLLRGLTFLATVGLAGVRLFRPAPAFVWVLAAAFAAAFVALVIAHAVLVTRISALSVRARLVERGQKRIAGDFAAFPERGDRFMVPDHAYAGDLDVFGASSLFQLVSAAQTGLGEATLASWLKAPASATEVAARQEAVRELAASPAFREELAFDGALAGMAGRDADPLLTWAEAPPALKNRALLRTGKILVPITAALYVASHFALFPGIFQHVWLVPFLLQVGVLLALRPSLEAVLTVASSREAPFGRWVALFRRIEGQPFKSARLVELRARLAGASGSDASSEIGALQRIVGFAELRHSPLVHVVANLALLWDIFCASALDAWRARSGVRVRSFLAVVAEMEALASLATFAYEHPSFAFPDVSAGELRFDAEALGHPLIQADRRVDNDLRIGGAELALLVTGSNMSGKSTLLRAVGLNAALALAGAPVCARRLAIAECKVRTSMRISDSLEEGVSHFYAELARLKGIVDASNQGDRVLFLLDEVLHGTNSRERQIGAKAVVRHLLDKGAIGAVSSHDLGLADLEQESGGRVRNVHLEELVADGKMTFDYKLKPGVVTTANALRLMKIVGIDVELPEI